MNSVKIVLCIIECKPNIISISKEQIVWDTIQFYYRPEFMYCTLCAVACPDNVIEVFRKES